MKKNIYSESLYDLIVEIEVLSGSLIDDLHKGFDKDNKSAMTRARVNSGVLSKLFKELRKVTIEDEKRSKTSK